MAAAGLATLLLVPYGLHADPPGALTTTDTTLKKVDFVIAVGKAVVRCSPLKKYFLVIRLVRLVGKVERVSKIMQHLIGLTGKVEKVPKIVQRLIRFSQLVLKYRALMKDGRTEGTPGNAPREDLAVDAVTVSMYSKRQEQWWIAAVGDAPRRSLAPAESKDRQPTQAGHPDQCHHLHSRQKVSHRSGPHPDAGSTLPRPDTLRSLRLHDTQHKHAHHGQTAPSWHLQPLPNRCIASQTSRREHYLAPSYHNCS